VLSLKPHPQKTTHLSVPSVASSRWMSLGDARTLARINDNY
jgi:hypothetical protein